LSNVAAEVARAMFEEDMDDSDLVIQCALLHDVLEDTDTTQEQLEAEFGRKVLEGVLALTKNSNLDKKDRMSDSLSRIKKQGREIACVKMADRITNLQKPPSKWSKEKIGSYLEEAIIIQEELSYASKYLSDRLKQKIEEYRGYQ
jgi:guanosine-3',5'-bis(diphosphate) 3'-pyrophosphohydrolase